MRRESIKVARSSARVQSVWSGTPRTRAISGMALRACPSTASLPEASTRFCVMPRRESYFGESYFEATGHSRGRAIFRALQRLLEALEVRRAISPLWFHRRRSPRVPPGTVTKRRPGKTQVLLFRWERCAVRARRGAVAACGAGQSFIKPYPRLMSTSTTH